MSVSRSSETSSRGGGVARPAVSVLVPFAGARADAQQMLSALAALELGADDEGVIADNSLEGVLSGIGLPEGWRTIPARREGSPAHTRNAAALAATRDWLLFLDADTQPPPDLLERFFAEPIPDDVGLVGGRVLSDESQDSLAARWADTRGLMAQENYVLHPFRPYLLSACLLVRREVWEELGGFYEGIFNGEDVDLCWRALDAGWKLTLSPEAAVVHLHRETVKALAKQSAVRAASARWIHRRWPEAHRPGGAGLGQSIRAALATPVLFLIGQRDRAKLRALDLGTALAAYWGGALRDNRALPRDPSPGEGNPVEVWCEEFPLETDGSVPALARGLRERGGCVLVVAERRPLRPALGLHDVPVRYLEDDTALERASALAHVMVRHPLACARELVGGARRGAAPSGRLPVLAPSVRRLLGQPAVEVVAPEDGAAADAASRAARLAGRRFSTARPRGS